MDEKSKAPQEIHSLNLDEIDVRELEKRLELSLAGDVSSTAAWSCCADGGSCPNLTCCEHGGGDGGGGGGGGGGSCTSMSCSSFGSET